MNYTKGNPGRSDLNDAELRELSIVKQAIIKSLIESKQACAFTPEVEIIVKGWIKYIRRNEEADWDMWKKSDKPF